MEALVAKKMMVARRQYFSIYGDISMGSAGTGRVHKAINNSRACDMNKPLAYLDFVSCSNKTIFPSDD